MRQLRHHALIDSTLGVCLKSVASVSLLSGYKDFPGNMKILKACHGIHHVASAQHYQRELAGRQMKSCHSLRIDD